MCVQDFCKIAHIAMTVALQISYVETIEACHYLIVPRILQFMCTAVHAIVFLFFIPFLSLSISLHQIMPYECKGTRMRATKR